MENIWILNGRGQLSRKNVHFVAKLQVSLFSQQIHAVHYIKEVTIDLSTRFNLNVRNTIYTNDFLAFSKYRRGQIQHNFPKAVQNIFNNHSPQTGFTKKPEMPGELSSPAISSLRWVRVYAEWGGKQNPVSKGPRKVSTCLGSVYWRASQNYWASFALHALNRKLNGIFLVAAREPQGKGKNNKK